MTSTRAAAAAALTLVALVLAAEAPAAAEAPPRVLGPAATSAVRRAMSDARPPLTARDQAVTPDTLRATVCRQDACATVVLTDPAAGCDAPPVGPWCLRFDAPAPAPELAAAIAGALAGTPPARTWAPAADRGTPAPPPTVTSRGVGGDGGGGEDGAPHPASDVPAWLVAIALLAGPVLLGVLGGRLLRRRVPSASARRVTLTALGLALLAIPLLALRTAPWLSTYDAGLAVLLALASAATVAWPRHPPASRAGLAVAAVAGLLALGAAELWARTLPAPPAVPPPHALHLSFPPETFSSRCTPLYPDRYPLDLGVADRPPGTLRVVHVGDSMVRAADVDAIDGFVARLDAGRRDQQHLNGGVPGTGTDYHLVLLRAWLPIVRPDRVVLHLFTGNDVLEIDRAYACCDAGPLLAPGGVTARCPAPRWRHDAVLVLSRMPAPFPLRVLASRSRLARWLVHAHALGTHALAPPLGLRGEGGLGEPARWARFEAILGAIAREVDAAGARLVVAVLPYRGALEAADPRATPAWEARGRMVRAAEGLGLPVLDAWPLFEARLRQHGDSRDFNDTTTWDVHLSPGGHSAYAHWLAQRLAALEPSGG